MECPARLLRIPYSRVRCHLRSCPLSERQITCREIDQVRVQAIRANLRNRESPQRMLTESQSRAFRTVIMVSVLAGYIPFITSDQLFQSFVRRLWATFFSSSSG